MDERTLVAAVERQDWLDPIADTVQEAVAGAFEAGGDAGLQVRDFLHGTWLGHPLHSAITDVPVGAWTTTFVLDLLEAGGREELGPGADTVLGIGLVGAVGAAITGLTDWHHTEGRPKKVGTAHALFNVTATALNLASFVARKQGARDIGRLLSGLGLASATAGAWLGGHLAYDEHIGVHRAKDEMEDSPEKFTAVLAAEELEENTPTKADANGVPIVLVKQGKRVHALVDKCAHMGGPLSEGTLEGDTIVCPWHGSRFGLDDGCLLGGPSVYNQPAFETRVRKGQIEVRTKPNHL